MSESLTIKDKIKGRLARVAIAAAILLVVFLLGFVPMWLSAHGRAAELEKTSTKLRKAEITNLLTISIVEAKRGEYETARQTASDFFTRLRAEDEKGDAGFLTADQRPKIKPIFGNRDAVITMLAQRDPASLDRLTDLYKTYTQILPARSPSTDALPTNVPAQ